MRFLFIVLPFCLLCCNSRTSEPRKFSYPPEWEPHEAIWTDFGTEFTIVPNHDSKAEIITVLSQHINTKVVFDDDSLKQMAMTILKSKNANLDSIQFIKTSGPMNWVRDPGPIFVSNGSSLRSLDFGWNCYGLMYDCENDLRGKIDNELAEQMNIEVDSVGLYLEGGGIEVSSNTILAYKAMANQRNPNKTLEEVSSTLIKALGKEQIIWLDEFPLIDKPGNKTANYFGNGANGHIDVSTRFLNDSTILATIISEEDKEKSELLWKDYEILNLNLKQLKAAKQPNGKPFTIITIEAPDYSLYEHEWQMSERYMSLQSDEVQSKFKIGDTIKQIPALEYANFTITNGIVLVSKYWKEGMPKSEKLKDEKIKTILKTYFPERDIIQLDVLPINWSGGGIHCRTKQQPKL